MTNIKPMLFAIAFAATLSIVVFVCIADYSTVHSTIGVVAGSVWLTIIVLCMIGALIADLKTNHGRGIKDLFVNLITLGFIICWLVLLSKIPILFVAFVILGIFSSIGKR